MKNLSIRFSIYGERNTDSHDSDIGHCLGMTIPEPISIMPVLTIKTCYFKKDGHWQMPAAILFIFIT